MDCTDIEARTLQSEASGGLPVLCMGHYNAYIGRKLNKIFEYYARREQEIYLPVNMKLVGNNLSSFC
jgi:hypothetical protein